MRTIPEDLLNHLLSGATTTCNCWKITRNDQTVKGFTDHDNNLTVDGTVYQAASGFIGTEALSRIGLSVDNMEIHSALSSGALEEKDLANGLYDNAEVEIYLVNWAAPEQYILIKTGNIGEVKRGSHSFMAEIRGLSHLLQQPEGRLYQQTCDAELGDNHCRVDLETASYTATATLDAILEQHTLITDDLGAYPTGWFRGGKLTWLTGENTNAVAEIKSHQNQPSGETAGVTRLTMWRKFSSTPLAGDQFRITAGCDKRFATCKSKFNNQLNFRGFPHIPGNDFIIRSPANDDN